tara:strand:- start:194 stop:475 length:282 start_codon:yes stop_codon:yes gene_type:complete
MKNAAPKFKVGEHVYVKRVFTILEKKTGGYVYPAEPVLTKVERVQSTRSLGFCYQLSPVDNKTDLGGVMYWEDELYPTVIDPEEEFWKTWGDQ